MPQFRKSQLSFAILACATLLMSLAWFIRAPTQHEVYLWDKGAPGALGTGPDDKPTINIFLPPSYIAARSGVIICPGGGYKMLMIGYEGEDIAHWFNSIGVAAFVLKYRIRPYQNPIPLEDALRAMRFVRYNAAKFSIDPHKIGIIGFSAGGHLASTVITHFDEGTLDPADPIDKVSARPDFAILGYPVITMLDPFTHQGTMYNLLGKNPTDEQRRAVSNELHVTPQTPPTFLFHTLEDKGVPAENSRMFYDALLKAHVPAELHLYEKGNHGAGLANGQDGAPNIPTLTTWPDLVMNWLAGRGMLSVPKDPEL